MKRTAFVLFVVFMAGAVKRVSSDDCNDIYKKISPTHTGCLPDGKMETRGVSLEDRKLIVDLHNELRAGLGKGNGQQNATDMLKMSWDDEIAMLAQKWTDTCTKGHDHNSQRRVPRMKVGQNYAAGQSNWRAAIMAWYNEEKNFVYGSETKGVTGHFTQIVWANTMKIGCGFTLCPPNRRTYVCNYGPAGNMKGKLLTPYTAGESGSGCLKNDNGLCDCGKTACINVRMNPRTCQCDCPVKDFLIKPYCGFDCTKIPEAMFFCGKGNFIKENCKKFSNLPYLCPGLCCPEVDTIRYNKEETVSEYGSDYVKSVATAGNTDVTTPTSEPVATAGNTDVPTPTSKPRRKKGGKKRKRKRKPKNKKKN